MTKPSEYAPLAKAQKKYNQKCKRIGIRFNMDTEQDLYDYTKAQSNVSGFIKGLIAEKKNDT